MKASEIQIPFEQPPLPGGYSYADRSLTRPEEIIQLRELEGWYGDTPGGWQPIIDDTRNIFVGVRDQDQNFVGMGRVTGDTRHAVMCDFVVHPSHRGKGLGTEVLLERMRKAEQAGIIYLYTDIKDTNPLKNSIWT
jgi:ribosomal protein S18 acetylase RimI-like enzyme